MALGASADRVMREIVGRGLVLTAAPVVIGLALALARVTRGVLFGVGPGDPPTLAAAAARLALVSLAACYVSARRAARVDPMLALNAEG